MLNIPGEFRAEEMDFIQDCSFPTSLKYVRQLQSGNIFSSAVCWTEDGELMSGGRKIIHQYDAETGSLVKQVNQNRWIGSMAIYKKSIVALSSTDDSRTTQPILMFLLPDLTEAKSVGNFTFTSCYSNNLIAVNPKTCDVILIDPNNKLLSVYSSSSELLFSTTLLGLRAPTAIVVLKDESLLIADCQNGSVNKFRLNNQKLEHVWTCLGLVSPTALSFDSAGIIYCLAAKLDPESGGQNSVISVISKEGITVVFSIISTLDIIINKLAYISGSYYNMYDLMVYN